MFEIRHCHYCSVDAHAKISALFLIMKWICVVGARGQYRGQLYVHLYCTLDFTVVSSVAWVVES